MLATSTRDVLRLLPPPLIRSVTRLANDHAEAIAEQLGPNASGENSPSPLPPAFVLELAAVLAIQSWERDGLAEHLPENLPNANQAREQFIARQQNGPSAFFDASDTPLSHHMLQVFVERFAWEAREILDAELLLETVDEDELVERAAAFIWENRHLLGLLEEHHDDEA